MGEGRQEIRGGKRQKKDKNGRREQCHSGKTQLRKGWRAGVRGYGDEKQSKQGEKRPEHDEKEEHNKWMKRCWLLEVKRNDWRVSFVIFLAADSRYLCISSISIFLSLTHRLAF